MRLPLVCGVLLVITACAPGTASTRATPHGAGVGSTPLAARCEQPEPPLGALPPAVPAWCVALSPGVNSAVAGENTWVDDFATGVSNAHIGSAYRIFEMPRLAPTTVLESRHFAHNGHWMVDVAGRGNPPGTYEGSAADFFTGPNNGGGLMRPDKAFRFEGGRLVVEFDVTAGMDAYGDRAWPEIVVSTAPSPSLRETNGWYAAGLFGGYPAIGCSVPADRLPECRVYDENTIVARLSARSGAGARTVFGGEPTTVQLDAAWRRCGPRDSDERCRDRFRLVLESDAVVLFVNGVRYMEHRGLPAGVRLPDGLLRGDVYVYFASWTYLVDPGVTRFHWGRLAINR